MKQVGSVNDKIIVSAANVTRSFAMPAGDVVAVRDLTLSIEPGEHTAISGPSGCGKSTLLHMLGCVDTPSSGTLRFDGQDISDAERPRAQPAASAAHRLRLSAILSAADADGGRERRAAAVGGGSRQG